MLNKYDEEKKVIVHRIHSPEIKQLHYFYKFLKKRIYDLENSYLNEKFSIVEELYRQIISSIDPFDQLLLNFDFSNLKFYLRLGFAVLPALALGYILDDKIEAVLGNQIAISAVLVIGGVVLLFADSWFKNPTIHDEKDLSIKQAVIIGFWQCLAMMPGTSRSAASIIGGMTQGLSRKAAAEFSFFLAVPTMLAVTVYSVFVKTWGKETGNPMKGYEMILSSNENILVFIIGNIVAFVVALIAIKTFISLLNKYGFRPWGWYRIFVGIFLLIYFTYFQ